MADIAIMTEADIGFAVSMTDHEGWAYLEDDFKRLIKLSPEGCFVAWENDERIGMITSVTYTDYGFLGCLIVREEYRGRKIGEALMRQAVDYLHSKSVRCIELDGVFSAASLYRRLGFQDKYLSLRFARHGSGQAEQKKKLVRSYLPKELTSFDLAQTGINRKELLDSYFREFADSLYVTGNDRLTGYAFVTPRKGGFAKIGPMVAKDKNTAEQILSDILKDYGGGTIIIGVPAVNTAAMMIILHRGFLYGQPSLRMYLGERRDYETSIYGIAAADKG